MVSKKDEHGNLTKHRCVVDYKQLNKTIETLKFPIPLIDDILDSLNGCKFFSTLDIKGAFYNIGLAKNSRDYTSFTANNFKYRWTRMPQGLSNSPITWQSAINTILVDLIAKGVYVCLDDVIVYAKSREEHDKILRQVLKSFKQHNSKMKISKCKFYARKFEYLGHILSETGITANPKKIDAIKSFNHPTSVKHVQSFLGLATYFRRYVKNFAKISKPLTLLLKKEQPFLWTPFQEEAFEKLKTALAEEVMLAFPDFDQIFYVTTDASNVAIGSMLSQGDLPNDRPSTSSVKP